MRHQTIAFGLLAILAAGVLSAQEGARYTKDILLPSGPVRLETTLGDIDIAVDQAHAPITSANFLRYVFSGYYDGAIFYRAARPDTYHAVLPNRPPMELIEARIPAGRPTYPPIPLERTSVTGLHHVTGTVAMGRNEDQPDSAASDFYILLNDQPSLDFGGKRFDDAQGTAAFGTVVAGMDVVRKINQQPVTSREATPDNPLTKTQDINRPVRITRAYRVQGDGPPRVGAFSKTVVSNYGSPPPPDPAEIGLGPNMIGGIVTEITRAPLADVVVTLTGSALAAPRVAKTDSHGQYQFTDVPAGTYTITFEPSAPGFKKTAFPNVVMRGRPVRRDCVAVWTGNE